MSFRRRMVLLAAGAVAVAVLLASAVVYLVTRNELQAQIDQSLQQTARRIQLVSGQSTVRLLGGQWTAIAQGPGPTGGTGARGSDQGAPGPLAILRHSRLANSLPPENGQLPDPPAVKKTGKLVIPRGSLGGPGIVAQLFQVGGRILQSESGHSPLPVTPATRAVAAGRRGAFFSDATIRGTPVRVLTEPVDRQGTRGVLQAATSLTQMDGNLSHLELVLALVCLGGIGLAAVLGFVVSRAALVPVRRLTGAAERVARTQNLGHRIAAGESDELGRLAESFNTMLAALERSRLAQRQLVSDASHELRTPLASIRANLDALSLGERLPPPDRARALASAQAQLSELAVLVGDLVDLSKTDVDRIELEDVRLDLAVAQAVERARLHTPACRFEVISEACLVRAAPARLDRAIGNLLDNAVKWGPTAGPVEVRVRAGTVEVRDHGPGIAPEDLPRVFDRFYRAASARSRPGSGLGLAIVRQAAESHGGAVHAANDPGGGARLTLELQELAMSESERSWLEAPSPQHVQEAPRML